jgi:hypothetical protein
VRGSPAARRAKNNAYARLIIRKSQQRLSREHCSNLLTEHLNKNAAMVNHACSEAKNNESLDQMRTTTIIYYLFVRLSRDQTASSFYATLDNASNTLTPNYAKIKIVGMEKLEGEWLTTSSV